MKSSKYGPLLFILIIAATWFTFAALTGVNTGKRIANAPDLQTRPAYQTWTTDPTFNTAVKRLTGDVGNEIVWTGRRQGQPAYPPGIWPLKTRHHYSKDQPWNSNGKALHLEFYTDTGTSNGELFLNGETYEPLWPACSSTGEGRWCYGCGFGTEYVRFIARGKLLEWIDQSTCRQDRKWNLPFTVDGIGNSEGNQGQGANGSRFVLLHDATRMFTVNMARSNSNGSIGVGPVTDVSACGLLDELGLPNCSIDWASISPSGNYAVVAVSDFLRVYDHDSNTQVLTPHAYDPNTYVCYNHEDINGDYDPNGPATGADPNTGSIFGLGHADMAISPFDANTDVIVGQRRGWCPNPPSGDDPNNRWGQIYTIRLSSGAVRAVTMPLDPNYKVEQQAWHISARDISRPGWIYATYWSNRQDSPNNWLSVSDPNDLRRYQDEVLAISLDPNLVSDPNAGIERWVNTHSTKYSKPIYGPSDPNTLVIYSQYRAEPHFVPAPNGMKGLWASNWYLDCSGNGCDPNSWTAFQALHAYVADMTYVKTGVAVGGHRGKPKYDEPDPNDLY